MRMLMTVALVCGCKGDPPASTPPPPGRLRARHLPPPMRHGARIVVPKALAADIAVILPNESRSCARASGARQQADVLRDTAGDRGARDLVSERRAVHRLKGGDVARLAAHHERGQADQEPEEARARKGDVIKRDVPASTGPTTTA